jgi:hypothetical protein
MYAHEGMRELVCVIVKRDVTKSLLIFHTKQSRQMEFLEFLLLFMMRGRKDGDCMTFVATSIYF